MERDHKHCKAQTTKSDVKTEYAASVPFGMNESLVTGVQLNRRADGASMTKKQMLQNGKRGLIVAPSTK